MAAHFGMNKSMTMVRSRSIGGSQPVVPLLSEVSGAIASEVTNLISKSNYIVSKSVKFKTDDLVTNEVIIIGAMVFDDQIDDTTK